MFIRAVCIIRVVGLELRVEVVFRAVGFSALVRLSEGGVRTEPYVKASQVLIR